MSLRWKVDGGCFDIACSGNWPDDSIAYHEMGFFSSLFSHFCLTSNGRLVRSAHPRLVLSVVFIA